MNKEELMKLNIQLFADEDPQDPEPETDPQTDPEDDGDDEGSKEPEKKETNVIKNKTKDESDKKKSFVQIREDKAREKIFKELGVKDLDEAKAKISAGETALTKISEIEKKLEQKDYEESYNNKVNKLTKILENEKVFDADALVGYVDIDKVELDENGQIKNSDSIIKQLKTLKPNFFGKEFIKTDKYNKGNTGNEPDPYKEDYDNKNYQGVIATYLKSLKNK